MRCAVCTYDAVDHASISIISLTHIIAHLGRTNFPHAVVHNTLSLAGKHASSMRNAALGRRAWLSSENRRYEEAPGLALPTTCLLRKADPHVRARQHHIALEVGGGLRELLVASPDHDVVLQWEALL